MDLQSTVASLTQKILEYSKKTALGFQIPEMKAVRAGYLFDVRSGNISSDPLILIYQGRILEMGSASPNVPLISLPTLTLLPALIHRSQLGNKVVKASTPELIIQAVKDGAQFILDGHFLNDEAAEVMFQHNVALISSSQQPLTAIKCALDHKVRIVTGDNISQEFKLLQEAGLTPLEIIQAATINARIEDVGDIKRGYRANIMGFQGHPMELNLKFVMRHGVVLKQDIE